ncbi:hypothetical protein [Falsiroseomonas selenitidurans]|uniref:Uncharacterized protein n=1 Tax=Falsiroseomonas selenitidurans TaxID=2716335 RepID=A0ABX1DXX8_9PROT|nr:hypothetical protein [Falsiroseomonas selenitidurans]NKC29726.1 hypothetical protein [Falsiroseomonas selenitidurans]
MRHSRTNALTLTLAAALLGGTALAPAPAAAQRGEISERGRFMTSPTEGTYYRRGEDQRLSAPWGGPGPDPMARRNSGDTWFDSSGRQGIDAFDDGYRAGREDERRWRDRSSGMSEARNERAAMEFLDHARMQIDRGNLREAWVALGQAETRLLTRAVPEGSAGEAATGAAIGAIRSARRALEDREADRARWRTARAMELAARGQVVGSNTAGSRVNPAGEGGRGQPQASGDRNSGNWNTGSN